MVSKGVRVLGAALIALAAGCASKRGDLDLAKVVPPGGAPTEAGVTDIGGRGGVYEDADLRITWTWSPEALEFDLLNKSAEAINILWNDAAIVTHDGLSHRVVSGDVRFLERNEPQPATPVPAGARRADRMVPADNVTFIDPVGGPLGLHAKPMFKRGAGPQELEALLPLDIRGARCDYTFKFYWVPGP